MSNGGPKLLLIDGKNMCHRVFWTHQELQYKGRHTGVLYGFFRQLIFLRKKFPEHYLVIAWDRGYARRKAESQAGVAAGIIPSAYKEQREKALAEADPKKLEELESLNTQIDQLQEEALPLIRCTQVSIDGVEADDVVYTYCLYVNKWNGQAVAVSSDKDFYQLLGIGSNVSVFDAMKDELWTAERFQMEFAFPATLWVDVGALQGDHCLAEGTSVPLLNGTSKTVEELSSIGRFWLYSCDDKGVSIPSEAICVKIGNKVPVVKVLLDNGKWIRCTRNHRFVMRDGSFRMAEHLFAGDSLMPFNTRLNGVGYKEMFNNKLLKWERVHSVVAKHCLPDVRKECVERCSGLRNWPVVHHKDFNKTNNEPCNLEWMTFREHHDYHIGLNEEKWTDADYRKRMVEVVCSKAGKIGGKATWSKHRSKMLAVVGKIGVITGRKNITKYNKSAANKPKARENILRYHRSPEFAVKRSQAAIGRVNADDGYRSRMREVGKKHTASFNRDKDQIERQLLGKVRKIVKDAISRFGVVDAFTYRECWKRGSLSWDGALNRFGQERIIDGLNHKVVSVADDGFADVYDLQVNNDSHLLALDAGVFVHNSDNIFGVDGWGPKTSCDYVRQYGNLGAILEAVRAKTKQSKKEQKLLDSISRVELAMSLKKMDEINHVPMPRCEAKDPKVIYDKFLELGFMSLLKDVKLLS